MSRENPVEVWRKPDEAFRYPVLEAMIGSTWLPNPPQMIKSVTLAASTNTPHFMVSLELFDAKWSVLPALLRLGLDEVRKEVDFTVRYGWPHDYRTVKCISTGLKNSVQPDGMGYTISGLARGDVKYVPPADQNKVESTGTDEAPEKKKKGEKKETPKPDQNPPWNRTYRGKISDIVIEILRTYFGYVDADFQPQGDLPAKVIVAPTDDDGTEARKPGPKALSIQLFLNDLAGLAKPLQTYIPEGKTEEAVKTPEAQCYISLWDLDGNYRFVPSIMYHDLSMQAAIPLTYPYPAVSNPLIEASFSDISFNSVSFIASGMDPLNPDEDEDSIVVGGEDGSIPMALSALPGDYRKWLAQAQSTQRAMAQRNIDAEFVLLGNPHIQFGTAYNFSMRVPGIPKALWPTFLNGTYYCKNLVHSVASDGYVTRVTAFKLP